LNASGQFDSWQQLVQSPRYAYCIAVDPANASHIAVGEREGDEMDITKRTSGVWESFDGGTSFDPKNYFNPLNITVPADIKTQVVNGVIITDKSTTIISTPCGIARKEQSAPTYTFVLGLSALNGNHFTTVTIFKTWIVARTKTSFFISTDDGKTWGTEIPIQLSYQNQDFAESDRGEDFSIALLQDPVTSNIFVYVPATRSPNGPCIGATSSTDPCNGKVYTTCNYSSYLIYNVQTNTWTYQILTDRGIGTGLGGRVFMKSFFSFNARLPSSIGQNTNLIYCGSENIFMASRIDATGNVTWTSIVNANLCGEPNHSEVHSDIWDFLFDPLGWYSWVSCDGGVFDYPIRTEQNTIKLDSAQQYFNLNSGLHNHHIHEAFVPGWLVTGPGGYEHYSYGAQDNGGWENIPYNNVPNWQSIANTSDCNKIEGDQGYQQVVYAGRGFGAGQLATMLAPGEVAAVAPADYNITVGYDVTTFQFIQTLTTEAAYPQLDAVMLTTLPLQYIPPGTTQVNVPGDLGSKTGPAINELPRSRADEVSKQPQLLLV
jgi:hypothetical protein